MGESAMKFKVKRASWWGDNLWKSKAFGYFDHTPSASRSVSVVIESMENLGIMPRRVSPCLP